MLFSLKIPANNRRHYYIDLQIDELSYLGSLWKTWSKDFIQNKKKNFFWGNVGQNEGNTTQPCQIVILTYTQNALLFFISRMECVLSAAVELWKAATVNQRQSWVFQELNLFFLFLEAESPSLLRILKKSSSSNTRQIEADNNTKRVIWNLHKKEQTEKSNK